MISITVEGKNIRLLDSEFKASGGEGDIYLKGGEIYKIYQNPIDSSFLDKCAELSVLTDKDIIRPEKIVYKGNIPVGYTMMYADNCEAFPLLFTTSFRQRHGITVDTNKKLFEAFQNKTSFIHEKGVLIVDYNEYNFLVSKNGFEVPKFIDVDSYQTPHHKAKVIMPSIRDYSANEFSCLSDWYSFAILMFQLYTGLHPFKGTHPSYSRKDLEGRMRNNVSVFNKETAIPASVRSFDEIPESLKTWFYSLFEKGQRLPPPTVSMGITKQVKYAPTSVKDIEETLVFKTEKPIIKHIFCQGQRLLVTTEDSFWNQKRVTIDASKVIYFDGTFKSKDLPGGFSFENRLYSVIGDSLTQHSVLSIGGKDVVTIKNKWKVPEGSSKLFSNVIISDVFGAYFAHLLLEDNSCWVSKIPIKEVKIVDAKVFVSQTNNFLLLVGYSGGQYSRYLFNLERKGQEVNIILLEEKQGIQVQEINAAITPKGMLVFLEDGDLILTNGKDSKVISNVGDSASFGTLVCEFDKLYLIRGNEFLSIRMK
jgi:serine/threonine protein kinase